MSDLDLVGAFAIVMGRPILDFDAYRLDGREIIAVAEFLASTNGAWFVSLSAPDRWSRSSTTAHRIITPEQMNDWRLFASREETIAKLGCRILIPKATGGHRRCAGKVTHAYPPYKGTRGGYCCAKCAICLIDRPPTLIDWNRVKRFSPAGMAEVSAPPEVRRRIEQELETQILERSTA